MKNNSLIIGILVVLLNTGADFAARGNNREKTSIPDSATFFINSIELVDSTGKMIDYKYDALLSITEMPLEDKKTETEVKHPIASRLLGACVYMGRVERGKVTRIKFRLPKMKEQKEITYSFLIRKGEYSYVQEFRLTPPNYTDSLNIRLIKSEGNRMKGVDPDLEKYKSKN